MSPRDPLGYYAILAVPLDASDEQLKAAYRRRAMALHPDRNPGHDTTEQFQLLNDAFKVLSDPRTRATYGAAPRQAARPEPTPEPIRCSVCGKVSAQPRVAVFRSVRSFVLVTLRKPVAGVFCSECAQKAALKASAITWLLGWWGIPWGPLHSLQALLENLSGGSHPALENARMLAWQAYCFERAGKPDVAHAVARDALKFCAKVRPTSRQPARVKERDELAQRLQAFIASRPAGAAPARLKNAWRPLNRWFPLHLAALLLAGALITWAVMSWPFGGAEAPPALAPNGQPWPSAAGYLAGTAQTRQGGHCQIVLDNQQNSAAVYVQLVPLGQAGEPPARQVFVPAGGLFTVGSVQAGRYELRYQELARGGRARNQPITLSETQNGKRIDYSVLTLTLQGAKGAP
ncbi:DnaJ domain-containing protein [Pseudomonas sp. NPDC007930]|uniref:J domain-containing protein n=1 Tax=Pseudomonas sp. NPDC007930 TaxID=3364417 RepID=UPI0036E3E30E